MVINSKTERAHQWEPEDFKCQWISRLFEFSEVEGDDEAKGECECEGDGGGDGEGDVEGDSEGSRLNCYIAVVECVFLNSSGRVPKVPRYVDNKSIPLFVLQYCITCLRIRPLKYII